jgi:hypothetical protein
VLVVLVGPCVNLPGLSLWRLWESFSVDERVVDGDVVEGKEDFGSAIDISDNL